jgi:succinylglutamate desuccinylase
MPSFIQNKQLSKANLSLYNYFKEQQNGPIPFSLDVQHDQTGKHVVFIVGAHGNEPGAIIAAQKLHTDLITRPELMLNGKVSFILGNPEAVRRNQKFISRIKNGSESKRVEEISQYFETNPTIDLVLDVYSSVKNKPRIVFYSINDIEHLKLASKISRFSLFVNINEEMFPGTLILSASKHGILSYGVSMGNEMLDRSISIAYDMMVAALERNDIIEKKVLEREKLLRKPDIIDIYYPRETIKPQEGFEFANNTIKTSDQIKKGEIYATYQGGFYMAHEDSYVLLLTKKVKRDNLGFLCKKYTLVVKQRVEKPEGEADK